MSSKNQWCEGLLCGVDVCGVWDSLIIHSSQLSAGQHTVYGAGVFSKTGRRVADNTGLNADWTFGNRSSRGGLAYRAPSANLVLRRLVIGVLFGYFWLILALAALVFVSAVGHELLFQEIVILKPVPMVMALSFIMAETRPLL